MKLFVVVLGVCSVINQPPMGDAKHAAIPTAQPATNSSVLSVSALLVALIDDAIFFNNLATIHEMCTNGAYIKNVK